MITREEFKVLLPLACAWAEEQERIILRDGVPLSSAPRFSLPVRFNPATLPTEAAQHGFVFHAGVEMSKNSRIRLESSGAACLLSPLIQLTAPAVCGLIGCMTEAERAAVVAESKGKKANGKLD